MRYGKKKTTSNQEVKIVVTPKKHEEPKPERIIQYGKLFEEEFRANVDLQVRVAEFLTCFKQKGVLKSDFCGRCKPSWEPKPGGTIPKRNRKFAKQHNLWHVHIGPEFKGDFIGDQTSDLVLHFQWDQKNPDQIAVLSIAKHYTNPPPKKFILPSLAHLELIPILA